MIEDGCLEGMGHRVPFIFSSSLSHAQHANHQLLGQAWLASSGLIVLLVCGSSRRQLSSPEEDEEDRTNVHKVFGRRKRAGRPSGHVPA